LWHDIGVDNDDNEDDGDVLFCCRLQMTLDDIENTEGRGTKADRAISCS